MTGLPERGDLVLVGAEHDGYQTSFDPVPGVVLEANDVSGSLLILSGRRARWVHRRWVYYFHVDAHTD